jgi:CBS domain containing-hemolysin-like protein
VLFALRENLTVEETLSLHAHLPFSRIPIYGENLDQVTGFILKSEILRAGRQNEAIVLAEMRRPLIVVPDTLPLHRLFKHLMDEKAHIALTVDEYGGTQGVVTMEDFIETLLGLEIVDEIDTVEDMQAMAREQWQKRALGLGLIDDEK